MNSEEDCQCDNCKVVREVLWLIGDLARSRKTGAIQAFVLDVAGSSPPERMTKRDVKARIKRTLKGE